MCLYAYDSVKKQLQPPYQGPYRVIDRKSKFFIIEKNGKQDSVSIDRLKVAHIVSETKSITTHVVEQPTPASAPEELLILDVMFGGQVDMYIP